VEKTQTRLDEEKTKVEKEQTRLDGEKTRLEEEKTKLDLEMSRFEHDMTSLEEEKILTHKDDLEEKALLISSKKRGEER
jgi:hypothetical protein